MSCRASIPSSGEAATHGDGPLLIVAGAGTGKTATLGAPRGLADRPGRRAGPDPAVDVHPPGGRGNAPPRGRRAPAADRLGGRRRPLARDQRASLGRHLPRRRHPAAPPLRQGDRPGRRLHDPRPGRLRRPHERRPHRTGPGQDRPPLPQEGDLPGHLQPLRQRPARSWTTSCRGSSPGASEWGEELKRLFDAYVDRKEAAPRPGLRRPAALLARPVGRSQGRAGRARAVRLRAGRRVPGHQRAAGGDPLSALAGRARG